MKLRTALATTAMFALLGYASTGLAHDGGLGPGPGSWGLGGPGHGRLGLGLLRAVGLTDAQRAQIRQILANHRPQLQSLRQQLRAAERQLHDRLFSATPPTTADLSPIVRLREQLAAEHLQIALEIRNVLTPDQLARAAQIRQQLQQLREQARSLLAPSS